MMNSIRHWADEICFIKGDSEYFVKYRSEMILYLPCDYDDDINMKGWKTDNSVVFQFFNLLYEIMNHWYSP